MTFISHGATAAVRAASFPLDEGLESGEGSRIAGLGWNGPRAQDVLMGPEVRVRMTAEGLGLTGVVDGGLRDFDYGDWRGLGLGEVEGRDPEGLMGWLTDVEARPHGGESVAGVIERTARWMEGRTAAGHTVAMTCPGVIKSAVVLAMGAPAAAFWRVDVAPLSLTDLRWNGRVWTVRCVSCAINSAAVLL
ncbi:histidine phosphatase family protein [Granulicella tundricola]|uniref:histidine phosphatase family protein n=1 Tax=Granulicella tundricola TaxID=940615 RepID=UPI0002F1074F|nr:histidine phosphatase family protein [Granulicella tundricola]